VMTALREVNANRLGSCPGSVRVRSDD
jgi:hypothetical protein